MLGRRHHRVVAGALLGAFLLATAPTAIAGTQPPTLRGSVAQPALRPAVATIPIPGIRPVLKTLPATATIPRFPRRVADYSSPVKTKDTVRLFPDDGWTPLWDGTAAGGCDSQMWFVRWRSLSRAVKVQAALGSFSADGRKSAWGRAGYAAEYACQRLFLRVTPGHTLTDVVVEVQRWDYDPSI